MTIITYKEGILAADKAEYQYGIVTGNRRKVYKLDTGKTTYGWAFSGTSAEIAIVHDLLHVILSRRPGDELPHQFKFTDEEVEAWKSTVQGMEIFAGVLVIKRVGFDIPCLYALSSTPYALPITSDEYAIGMEAPVIAARAAMMAGADAVKAIEIACNLTNMAQMGDIRSDVQFVSIL
nr:MAG TPA: hypothetical protein [Caudoviricetes sp.]